MRQRSYSKMYAISGSSNVYHLVYPDQLYTLCGFTAENYAVKIAAKAALHIVEFVPYDRELCKHCEKMKKRRQANSEGQGSSNTDSETLSSKDWPGPPDSVLMFSPAKDHRLKSHISALIINDNQPLG